MTVVGEPSGVNRLRAWYERWADPLDVPTPTRASSVWPNGRFEVGVNLPWLHYGCDVGANAWQPATVGLASARSLNLVRGLDLDLYQIHWYDAHELRAPLDRRVSSFALDRPVLLGEFPTRGSRQAPHAIIETARRNGFAGALAWSALSRDDASDKMLLAHLR